MSASPHVVRTVRRQLLTYIIQRNIFCPVSGEVLDVRTAKYFVDKDGDPAYVLSPKVYDAVVTNPGLVAQMEARGYFVASAADCPRPGPNCRDHNGECD